VLERMRTDLGQYPVRPTSWCRCQEHNARVGGVDGSPHTLGLAVDFLVESVHADAVAAYLEEMYPDRYGIGRYTGRTHLDVKPGLARRWDNRKRAEAE